MARRGLRGGDTNYTKSSDFSSSDLSFEIDDSTHLSLRTRTIVRPMDALSDTSDGEAEEVVVVEPAPARRTRSSRSRSVEVAPKANGSTMTRTMTSTYTTTTKTLHLGLDAESDADDGTESTVPSRATPFTARSGTPLARAPTPLASAPSRSSVPPGDGVIRSRGYTLAKGAIAEEVEEEELEDSNTVTSWKKVLSWRTIRRITTYITTTVVMAVVSAVVSRTKRTDASATTEKSSSYRSTNLSSTDSTSTEKSSLDSATASEDLSESASYKKTSTIYSFISTITRTSRRVVDTGSGLLTSSRDQLRKKPILLWIPLIPLLILLALVASWWLAQSEDKAADSDDHTHTPEGPSFLTFALNSASQMTNWVIGGLYYGLLLVWEALVEVVLWVVSACVAGLCALWSTIASMGIWLGSTVHSGLTHILETLYLMLECLQVAALAVISFFSSSVSYISGFLFPLPASDTPAEATATQSEATSTSVLHWVSAAYTSISEAAQNTQTWLWDGWLWVIISVGHGLSTAASAFLWAFGALWSLVWFLLSGLWAALVYIFTGAAVLVTSGTASVTSVAVDTSAAVASGARLIFLPLFGLFNTTRKSTKESVTVRVVQDKPLGSGDAVKAGGVAVAGVSIEEVVSRVLQSAELKSLITTVTTTHTSAQQQHLSPEAVEALVKSVVVGQLSEHRSQATAEMKTHVTAAAQETRNQVLSLEKHHQDLITQLALLGATLTQLQGSMEANKQGLEDHRHDHSQQLLDLRSQIEKLTLQLRELEKNHTTLASEVKSCCKNTSVTLADVERHVTALLGDILGLSAAAGASGHGDGSATLSVKDMGAWLRSYFVAKEELEARLNTVMAALQKSSSEESAMQEEAVVAARNAAVAQSTQLIMETVLEKLREELHKQHTQFADVSGQQVAQQVSEQLQAAATVLGQQMEQQLHTSKQQLQHSVSAAVEDAVPRHVAAAVPGAVSSAVSKTVPEAVASAAPGIVKGTVDTAVHAAVGAAVDEAVAAAVPGAVNVAVSDAVTVAVANAVPAAVEEALPDAVAAEVHSAVSVAVPEVVASVLPAAVSTAVNDTVTEALIDVKVSNAGGAHVQVNEQGEDGIVVVAGSSTGGSTTTTTTSSATLSATVNISNNDTNGANLFVPVGLPMNAGLNESAVARIVKEALLKYDADKTGMVDHALESAGGNIISTRCTENYQVHLAELSILGVRLFRYHTNNNPRIIIQPERMPGQCWAFKGSQGYIVVKLAGNVLPTGFTLEHIPRSLSPSGEIDSAPKEFEVWGLHTENDEGFLMGSYEYKQDGDPFQYFPVKHPSSEYYPMIELKINSNHGNLQYTCIYRFRVHGVRLF